MSKIKEFSIHSPEMLMVRDGAVCTYGASQTWYPAWRQRAGGCGPTNCAHLLWYLAATRPECRPLCPWDAGERGGMLRLMRAVWEYVTPGCRGVDTPAMFTQGARRYGQAHGVPLHCRVLEIPDAAAQRPREDAVLKFLGAAFADDLPVAFLNRSNGAVRNLDEWHWVTLVAADPNTLHGLMYDQGRCSWIDLDLWLRTAKKGGGLVALEPDTAAQQRATR